MSVPPTNATTTGLEPTSVGRTVPAAVQAGDPRAKQAYASALDFEQMLVGELTQSLVQGSGIEGEEAAGGSEAGEGGGGANPLLSSLVPQALDEGVMRDGGLGLATQLTSALDPSAGEQAQATRAGGAQATPAPDAAAGSSSASSGGAAA